MAWAVPSERGAHLTLPRPMVIEAVEAPRRALERRDRPVRARGEGLQLVRADRRGRRPWWAGFDNGRGAQPVLGARAAAGGERSSQRTA